MFAFSVGNEWQKHSAPNDAKNKCRVFALGSEMNRANIRLRMSLKLNVGCLHLPSEMHRANIRLRMTLKINVACLHLASEMNRAHIRLRMSLKLNVGCLQFTAGNESRITFGSVCR